MLPCCYVVYTPEFSFQLHASRLLDYPTVMLARYSLHPVQSIPEKDDQHSDRFLILESRHRQWRIHLVKSLTGPTIPLRLTLKNNWLRSFLGDMQAKYFCILSCFQFSFTLRFSMHCRTNWFVGLGSCTEAGSYSAIFAWYHSLPFMCILNDLLQRPWSQY